MMQRRNQSGANLGHLSLVLFMFGLGMIDCFAPTIDNMNTVQLYIFCIGNLLAITGFVLGMSCYRK